MATTNQTNSTDRTALGSGGGRLPVRKAGPDAYVSLGGLLDPTKPDNRDILVQTYGDQGITGFLELTGAKKSTATSDEVQWWEEGRLHQVFTVTMTTAGTLNVTTPSSNALRLNDVLLTPAGQRLVVMSETNNSANNVKALNGGTVSTLSAGTRVSVIGNIYAQGTPQPTKFYQTDLKKFINPFFITKEVYTVNGSQATNIG